MYSNENIERLIEGKCEPQEALSIIYYLDEHPELLINYFSISEWENFKSEHTLDTKTSNNIWQGIAHKTFRPSKTVELFKKLAIAASLLFIIGLSWILFAKKEHSVGITKVSNEPIKMKLVENNFNYNLFITLPDSSEVELYPHSSLSYPEKFTNHERGTILIGEAIFKVTKDITSPFSVFSDSLVTTVLGTRFRVQSFEGENTIKVTLYEGKVSVKSISLNPKSSKINYILFPGDMLVYDKQKMISTLWKNKVDLSESKVTRKAVNTSSAISNSSNWYMFNNQKLSDVFDQLSILYNVKIHYNSKDLTGRTFIGKIDKTDSLQSILQSIGLLNKLIVTKEEDGYHIVKN